MADWIAWQKGLTQKREVLVIASRLDVTRREAAAMCMEVFEWADSNTVDGYIEGVTAAQLSESLSLHGLGESMVSVGWIIEDNTGLTFINFDRWNGETAKERLRSGKRVARHRRRQGKDGIGAKKGRMGGD